MKKHFLFFCAILWAGFASAQALVTFSVDLNSVGGFTQPYVSGSFNGWCGNCNPMSDPDLDGIWDATISIPAGAIEYKFTLDNWTQQENLTPGMSCTVTNFGFTNRSLNVTVDETLPVVCWQSCNACAGSFPVTFKVDMNGVSGFTQPTVNGSFAGWCGDCLPMTDSNLDGIWEATTTLPAGNYEYKFAYDNWAGQETLMPGSSCTITTSGFTNRTLALSAATVLPVVCWAQCVSCDQVPVPANVTFRVDMNMAYGFTQPTVNGIFNSWCGDCNPMTDINSDGIWEATISLMPGSYEYKFAHDNWLGSEQLAPGTSCTLTTGPFTNRLLNVTGNVVLPIVCYGYCSACVYPVNDARATAQVISSGTPTTCALVSGNLAGAQVSVESQSTVVTGEDLWYRFVAPETGVRIQVEHQLCNTVIELQDASGTMLDQENTNLGYGFEILNYGGLTVGQTYYVAVRNFNSGTGNGAFTLCIKPLRGAGCDSGVGPFTLCNTYKARWGGATATNYSFAFTEVAAPFATWTRSQATDICVLSNVVGLEYGRSYTVVISTTHTVTNGSGAPETVTLTSPPCSMSLVSSPSTDLRASDESSNGCRFRGSVVASLPWVCGASNWAWEFQELDNTLSPVGLPIQVLRGAANNLINLGSVAGLQYGKTYAVRTAPVYAYTNPSAAPGVFSAVSWGPVNNMCIVGSGMSAFEGSESAMMNLDTRSASFEESSFAVYPNPNTGDMFNLNMTGIKGDNVVVNVLDATGRLIESQRIMANGTVNTIISFRNHLSDGLYFVELRFDNRRITEKLVVGK